MSDYINTKINRILLLRDRTVDKGCTEAEAMEAANMVNKLLKELNMTMTDIEYKNSKFDTISLNTHSKVRNYLYKLVSSIGYFTDCAVTIYKEDKTIFYTFFGSKHDIVAAEYLFKMLESAIQFELSQFKIGELIKLKKKSKYSTKTLTNSFVIGLTERLCVRLYILKNDQKESTNNTTGIVLYDKREIMLEEFNKYMGGKIRNNSEYKPQVTLAAYRRGREAANNIIITKAIEKGSL